MRTLGVLLIWVGVLVVIFGLTGLLPVIGFFAVIGAGFWASAAVLGDSSRTRGNVPEF